MQKPKALYFDIKKKYINSWIFEYQEVLKNVFDLDIHYLEDDIENINIFHKNYDFIISTLNLFLFAFDKNTYYEKDQLNKYNSKKLKEFIKKYKSIVDHSKSNIFISDIDHYSLDKKKLDKIEKSSKFIIARNLEFLRTKKRILEFNGDKEIFFNKVNDNWRNFVKENKKKIIALQGVLSTNEFLSNYNIERKYQISVPGIEYHQRKIIKYKIKQSNIKYFEINKFFKKILYRFNKKEYKNQFIKTLRNSISCYTNGSALGYPIRKFFEIPANRSLLLCEPFEGFENYGFRDGVNCIIVNENTIIDKFNETIKDEDKTLNIINNAYNLIWENHTIKARSNQLQASIAMIMKNNFNGSAWIKGRYVHF